MARTLVGQGVAVWRPTLVLLVAVCLGCQDERLRATDRDPAAEPDSIQEQLEDPQPSNRGWVRMKPRSDHPDADLLQDEIDRLQALGYVSGSEAPREDHIGVTVHVPGQVTPGLNLVISGHGHEAFLMDVSGRVLHTWRKDVQDAFPGRESRATHFRRAHLFPNGDLLVLYARADGMVKVDRCSNVLWTTHNGAHHDFQVQPGGNIYALVRKAHVIPGISAEEPVLEDFVAVLGPSGEEIRRVSLLDALMRSEFAHLWERGKPRTGDVFHTNSLDVLREWSHMGTPGFRRGRVLVSIRKLSLLAVLDMDQERVAWALKADFRKQHAAQILRNGNILLFDNVGLGETSRILELDASTGEPVWEYPGDRRASFFSEFRGQVQRFSNGNTLITETDSGRAFEVSPEGKIVWEFFNPRRAGSRAQFIAALLDVRRLPPAFPTDWIQACPDS